METELQSLTRREFSITTAVTAVACVTGIPTSAICESTHKKKLQIGIIGTCGANTDIRSLIFWLDEQIKIHDHPANIRIIGISESNLRLQNKYTNIVNKKYGMGCTGYSSFQEMLQKESGKIDAVFIFSPLEERERHVTECLIRKIPVFCVAPLAQDLETVRRLVSLARKTGTLLSCNSLGWGGGNAKLYRFCREKLCGSGGLLGKCVRMSSESYVAAGQEPGNHKNGVPSSPFAPNNGSRGIEANCAFWKMVGIKSFFAQCLNIRWFNPQIPQSVTCFQGPVGKYLSTADLAVFQYEEGDRTVFTELSLHNKHYAVRDLGLFRKSYAMNDSGISYRGDYGSFRLAPNRGAEDMLIEMEIYAGTDSSNYAEREVECQRRWHPVIRNPNGTLGQCVDIASRHLDYRSYIWRCETDGKLDEKAFRKLEDESAGFEGKRNLWRFPEEVLNDDTKSGIENYEIADFLNSVRAGKADLESAVEVFRAQVMVCGIAESVRTGKPFHFTPEMFEV